MIEWKSADVATEEPRLGVQFPCSEFPNGVGNSICPPTTTAWPGAGPRWTSPARGVDGADETKGKELCLSPSATRTSYQAAVWELPSSIESDVPSCQHGSQAIPILRAMF